MGITRRSFARGAALAPFLWHTRGAFAQALTQTPSLTIGPYYPNQLPLDLDNDLLLINDAINPGVGEVMWVNGRVLDASGNPVKTIAHDGTVTFYAYDAKGRQTERATFPSSYATATTRPALADALVGIGRCEEAEGRADSAANWYRKALDAAPGHPLASRLLTALSPRN